MSFWEIFVLLLIFVPLLMLWLFTLGDLAKRADISGLAKGLWAVLVVILPVIGMLVYFIARPSDPEMQPDPSTRLAEIRGAANPPSTTDQIERLGELRDSGILSDDEFTAAKLKILDSP